VYAVLGAGIRGLRQDVNAETTGSSMADFDSFPFLLHVLGICLSSRPHFRQVDWACFSHFGIPVITGSPIDMKRQEHLYHLSCDQFIP